MDDPVTDQPSFDVIVVEVYEGLEQGVAVDAADDGRDSGHHEVERLLVDVLRQKSVLFQNIKCLLNHLQMRFGGRSMFYFWIF